jgi:hypothetical protein
MRRLTIGFLFVVAVMAIGCTTYYRVTDPTTGKTYYSTDLERSRDGAVTLQDERSGAEVTIQNSEITEMKQGAYEAQVAAPDPEPAPDATSQDATQ